MITIDNDYMINERGFDAHANLKSHDNASNIVDIFYKQLSYRMYDFIIANGVQFKKRKQIDEYLNEDEERVDDFRRALAEQAIYLLVNGDPSMMIPDHVAYREWLEFRVSPATLDILRRLQLLRTVISGEELFYDHYLSEKRNDPTRNW